MKDIYGITKGFLDKEGITTFINDLYKNKSFKGLSEFWLCNQPEGLYKKLPEIEQLDLTLKYLYPLLRDGKLKVRIKYFDVKIDKNGVRNYEAKYIREYKKEEAKKAIRDIRSKWLRFNNKIDRETFEEWGVQFTLPENEWEY